MSEARGRRRGIVLACLVSLGIGGAALPLTWPRVLAYVYPWAEAELSGLLVSVTQDGDRLALAVKRDGDGRLVLLPRVPTPEPERAPLLKAGARVFKRPEALSLQVDGTEWFPLARPTERVALVLATWLAVATSLQVLVLLVVGARRRPEGTPAAG